jgi:hypothetical protein
MVEGIINAPDNFCNTVFPKKNNAANLSPEERKDIFSSFSGILWWLSTALRLFFYSDPGSV